MMMAVRLGLCARERHEDFHRLASHGDRKGSLAYNRAHALDRSKRPVSNHFHRPRRPHATLHTLDGKRPAHYGNSSLERGFEFLWSESETHKRAQEHISRYARTAVDVGVHLEMREAMTPALKPLSIFTTLTLDAQELSMVRNAAMPFKWAPYPTDVGTAITGHGTRPPTTLGRAPSMPAQTMTADAFEKNLTCAMRR